MSWRAMRGLEPQAPITNSPTATAEPPATPASGTLYIGPDEAAEEQVAWSVYEMLWNLRRRGVEMRIEPDGRLAVPHVEALNPREVAALFTHHRALRDLLRVSYTTKQAQAFTQWMESFK